MYYPSTQSESAPALLPSGALRPDLLRGAGRITRHAVPDVHSSRKQVTALVAFEVHRSRLLVAVL